VLIAIRSRSGYVRNFAKQWGSALFRVLVRVRVVETGESNTSTTPITTSNVTGRGDFGEILLSKAGGGNAAALR
jgi:hypothetical protein